MEMSENSVFEKPLSKNHRHSSKNRSAKGAFKDLCIYLVFLTVTTIITISSKEIGMYYFNNTIERLLIHPPRQMFVFEDLVTIDDWWSYLQTTFIDKIAHFELKNSSKNLTVGGNILLGVPRLRQIRVKSQPCVVDQVLQNYFKTCHGPYSVSQEDTEGFLNTKHKTQSELSTYTIWGSVTHYRGAGYVQLLSLNQSHNEEILSNLHEEHWIDSATRIVLLEFTLFNANANLFCNAKFLSEIPATGGIITSTRLQAVKSSPLWNKGGFFVPFCALAFLGLILYYTFQAVREIVSKGCGAYFDSVMKVFDIIIFVIAYFSVAYIIWHTLYLKSILAKYTKNKDQYLNLDTICFWNLLFVDAMGICGFIVWIQILKYIKFNKTMMQFSTTLQRCSKDLLGFSIMFSVVFVAYAYLAVLWFGSVDSDFYDFPTAIVTLMRMVLGDIDYERLEEANRVLGPVYFLSFILFIFFILMNMFLAIINDTYSDVKSEIAHGKDNELEEYMTSLMERLRRYMHPASKKDDHLEHHIEEKPNHQPKASVETLHQISPSLHSIPSAQSRYSTESEPPAEQRPRTMQDLLDSFFEIVSVDRQTHEDPLNQRVSALEQKMERLVEHLDEILSKIGAEKSAGRSL